MKHYDIAGEINAELEEESRGLESQFPNSPNKALEQKLDKLLDLTELVVNLLERLQKKGDLV